MKTALYSSLALAATALVAAQKGVDITPEALMDKIELEKLLEGSQQLEDFAYNYPERNRVFGSEAHKDTVNWLYDELKKTGYYDVEKQEQEHLWTKSDQKLTVADEEVKSTALTYSPSGEVEAEFHLLEGEGCTAEEFPAEVKGKIVLVQRGTCTFGEKVALSGAAEAVGTVVYNNAPGDLAGTLGEPESELGPYVPVVGITQEAGEKIATQIGEGAVSASLFVDTKMENRTTHNVLATSKGGDKNNVIMIGAHTDSVEAGPGINDDGSGTIGILNIAKALTGFKLNNAVRFGFWTAEEFGLLGSTYYVNNSKPEERQKIRLYLNFDMIASPNYANLIYDGDGSEFDNKGPAGSAEIEKLFEEFFDKQEQAHFPTEFDGRSDYDAFIQNGIPAGGIFTGAEGVKTEEQAKLFGGTAGEAYDKNYHAVGDNMENLAHDAYVLNTKGAAYGLATYARSTESLPPKEEPAQVSTKSRVAHKHTHCSTGCGHRCEL